MSILTVVQPRIHRIGDGLHEQGVAEHILIVQSASPFVVGKVHDQWTHHRTTLLNHIASHGVDIGQQAIAQLHSIDHGIIGPVALLSKLVNFADHRARAVIAHQGHERTPLHPARLQFLSSRALRIVVEVPIEESAKVGVPEGDAAERVVQSRGNLALHLFP